MPEILSTSTHNNKHVESMFAGPGRGLETGINGLLGGEAYIRQSVSLERNSTSFRAPLNIKSNANPYILKDSGRLRYAEHMNSTQHRIGLGVRVGGRGGDNRINLTQQRPGNMKYVSVWDALTVNDVKKYHLE